jgi:uncharacterized protein YegP (UPF0339 family)
MLLALLGTPGDIRLHPSPLAQAQAGETQLKFEFYEDRAKEHRWRLKAANNKILATAGQGYAAKASAKTAVENLIKDINKYTFEVYEDRAKEFRWRLKASNGQIVAASSEGYNARAGCEHAIDLIKKNVAKAQVD